MALTFSIGSVCNTKHWYGHQDKGKSICPTNVVKTYQALVQKWRNEFFTYIIFYIKLSFVSPYSFNKQVSHLKEQVESLLLVVDKMTREALDVDAILILCDRHGLTLLQLGPVVRQCPQQVKHRLVVNLQVRHSVNVMNIYVVVVWLFNLHS